MEIWSLIFLVYIKTGTGQTLKYFTTSPYAVATFHDTLGKGPVRFVFKTSDSDDYDDETIGSPMQVLNKGYLILGYFIFRAALRGPEPL